MNIIKGRIEIRGTGVGISGLLVHALVAPKRQSTTRQPAPRRTSPASVGRSLGSVVTQGGDFVIQFEDAAFRTNAKDTTRPDILIVVLSPEEPGKTREARLLYTSDVRREASQQEFFLIHLETSELKKHRVALPEIVENTAYDPVAVGLKAAAEAERVKGIRKQLLTVAKAQVVEARAIEQDMDAALRDRVLQHLTGLKPETLAWGRFVPPGGDVTTITQKNQTQTIKNVVNTPQGQETYLTLSPEEYEALLDASGQPLAEKVEARLRGSDSSASRLREDPLAKECLRRQQQNPFDPQPPVVVLPAPPASPPTSPTEPDVTGKLVQLLHEMQSPEQIMAPEGLRPDAASVDAAVGKLSLSKGPADVAALYDFHNLQIAFDYIWEDARAEGILEAAKTAYRQIQESGGDAKAALKSGGDPLRALAREAAIVKQTLRPDFLDGGNDRPTTGYSEPPPEPPDREFPFHAPEQTGINTVAHPPQSHERYPFAVFAAGSINFGLLVTYRQRWEPVTYQVGRLAKTLTLAPKESVSYSTRQVVKTSLSQKQMNSNLQSRKEDADDTQREEAEIVARAESKTNFSLTTEGGFDLGPLGEGSATTNLGKDAATSSQETKKAFREAVRKSSQEFRDERKLEVETTESSEVETTEKREISNPNDELTVTYLFYELQRRFRISERLHRVTPVVLVAQSVPRPEQVNANWVLRHDWIIKRFLLDDSFLPALSYISTRVQGDRIILADLYRNMMALRGIVEELKLDLKSLEQRVDRRYAAIQEQLKNKAAAEQGEGSEGFWGKALDVIGNGDDDASVEAIRIREEAARDAYDRDFREAREKRGTLDREISALQVATDNYTKAKAQNTNHQVQVNRLVQHVRDNILHYMQGIWGYEQPDQRLFRHHTLEAPRLTPRLKQYALEAAGEWPLGVTPQAGKQCYKVTFTTELNDNLEAADQKATLAELADLDKPLGFKGNYIIFPLKESNALTDFMMAPYLDAELGLRDPDGSGNWTLEEFSRYVTCLREKLGAGFAEVEPELRKQYQQILSDPLRDGEEIIVPTSSLYMEALVGTQPLMEDFKLLHRGLDVMKVKAEVRQVELENLRKAARLVAGEREDPDIDRKIVIEGGSTSVVVTPVDS